VIGIIALSANAAPSWVGIAFIAAGVLAILLALTADGLLALFQRLVTPWSRIR
jgi:hypothetical protein